VLNVLVGKVKKFEIIKLNSNLDGAFFVVALNIFPP